MPCCEIFIDGIPVRFKVFQTAGKVSQKQDFIKFLETAIRGGDMIWFGNFCVISTVRDFFHVTDCRSEGVVPANTLNRLVRKRKYKNIFS